MTCSPLRALPCALAVGIVLTGCSNDEPASAVSTESREHGPGAGAPATPSSAAATTAPPGVTATATSGPVSVTVALPAGSLPPVLVQGEDESVALAVGVGSPPVTLTLEAGRFVINLDGSLTIAGDDGTPLGGFAVPATADVSARFTVLDENQVKVVVPALSTQDPTALSVATVDLVLGSVGLRSAVWGEHDGGRSLAVDPTPWARQSGQAGLATVRAQVAAAQPEAGTPGMSDQLTCHAIGAPDKATWNLEPWRPDVGLVATMAAGCNPR